MSSLEPNLAKRLRQRSYAAGNEPNPRRVTYRLQALGELHEPSSYLYRRGRLAHACPAFEPLLQTKAGLKALHVASPRPMTPPCVRPSSRVFL